MTGVRRRFAALATVGVVGVPLVVVGGAFGCANYASVKLDRAGGTAGSTVSFVGRNFNSSPAASAVAIRWNSRAGQVLQEVRAVNGKVRGTFTVPRAKAGYYVIVATQIGPNGRIASGTPGRAPFKLRAASKSSAYVAPASPGTGPAGLPPAAVGGGLLALALLGGAGTLAARRRTGTAAL